MFKFSCCHCSCVLETDEGNMGKTGKCSNCGMTINIIDDSGPTSSVYAAAMTVLITGDSGWIFGD